MQTTSRPRNGASFAVRRGHLPQLSISDDNHHVTEAIGHMYGEEMEQESRRTSSPLNPNSPPNEHAITVRSTNLYNNAPSESPFPPRRTSASRKQIPGRNMSNGNIIIPTNSSSRPAFGRLNSWERQNGSPTSPIDGRERSPSDTATSPFPLDNIDYESSPAGLAQELSNLQALRRMSMDVGAPMDPDLPQLNAATLPKPPSPSSSEDDTARLFWVPARLHPELAPKEFKSFLDSKAEQIKRRSGDLSAFTSPMTSRSSSLNSDNSSGLRRRPSMLSRQIDDSAGYQDGAERLERRKSLSQGSSPNDPNLKELESLVSGGDDGRRLSLEGSTIDENGDVILPSAPGASLKRSTRTAYRRAGGSSLKKRGDRPTFAERAARRSASNNDIPEVPELPDIHTLSQFVGSDVGNLASTLRDPGSSSPPGADKRVHNFSRPAATTRTPSPPSTDFSSPPPTFENILGSHESLRQSTNNMPNYRRRDALIEQTSANNETQHIPQIVEVPPPEESVRPSSAPSQVQSTQTPIQPPVRHPERSSSREDRTNAPPAQRPAMPPKQNSSIGPVRQPADSGSMPPQNKPTQTLDQPSPLPGMDTNTSNLSVIPTLTVDKRADHKMKEEPKKSGWGWLLGKEDGKDKSEKAKLKSSKPSSSHDNTRLDVLQTSIDGGGKGRESFVLDRESLKLEEERKKESVRKSSGSEGKKEKESLFSAFFGGGKKSKDKDGSRKHRERGGLSPEPPYRELKPDIDYNWTRFPILEERAIYRMAHIKLANPRRALYSQVLLSNFMYSYLAKVQQMHPHMNLPTSAKQQRKQQQKEPQPDEFVQYQRYQQQQQAHQQAQVAMQQPAAQPVQQPNHQGRDYDGESSSYDYEAASQRPSSRGSKHSTETNGSVTHNEYNHQFYSNQPQQNQHNRYGGRAHDDDDDMW